MANVLKHSRATRVHIELMYRERQVRFAVSDNGRGFIPGPLSEQNWIWTPKLSKQAPNSLEVKSMYIVVAHGTRVIAFLPIRSESA
jgi:signal transduction histidine kinase